MKILIGNRGEIACRIIKTCKRMNIETVALYTPEDKFSKHVKLADYKISLPSGPFKNNYLNIDLIILKAKEVNVNAVHPGYGFFSEVPEACLKFEQVGIVWIGPTHQNISDMALKHVAKNIANELHIPTCNYDVVESLDECFEAVEKINYPIILKLSSGGGGLGMFKCESKNDIEKYFPLVEQTNRSLYSNDSKIFVEKYIENAHHIEVQIVGDGLGNCVTLGERECSIQRRNQKLIEETPSPYLNDKAREKLYAESIKLASYLKYKSVGTIEFIFDDDTGDYFFLEINTRLQVEHTVTEQTFKVDIVEIMIRLALFDDFSLLNNLRSLKQQGHAIEARLCAEDPLNNFTPSFGRISYVNFKFDDSIRIDTWIEDDCLISPVYDSLLAKAISYAETREEAIKSLTQCLDKSVIQGVSTNMNYLANILKNEKFHSGNTLTNFLTKFKYKSYSCSVIESGMGSLIVDYPGRVGYWNIGLPPSGPIDMRSHRIANYLVDNSLNEACIEILLDGLVLKFNCNAYIAITGSSCQIKINEQLHNMYESLFVKQNSLVEIRLTGNQGGCRSYLAIRGGIQTQPYLGSRSTFTAGKLGGLHGEQLRINDVLPLLKLEINENDYEKRKWPEHLLPEMKNEWTLLAQSGPHGLDYFKKDDLDMIWSSNFQVSHNANRLGIRLNSEFVPKWTREDGGDAGFHPSNVHDYPYAIGSVNFSGNFPIILTVDGPSLGGFVCPITIIQSELWKVGQLRPGDTVKFKQVDYDYAIQSLKLENEILSNPQLNLDYYDQFDQPNNSIIYNPILQTYKLIDDDDKTFLFRYSGDTHILVEIEMQKFEIENRFYLQFLINRLVEENYDGLLEMVPGVSSLLIKYDPFKLTAKKLAELIIQIVSKSSNDIISKMLIKNRLVRLPLAFRDKWSSKAIDQYMKTISNRAPYLPDNCEFVRKINDIQTLEDLSHLISETKYLVLGLGDVYLGAPCAVPYDPRHRIITTKYNPARTFTPEGAVGIGGIYMCIYGMDSPGGYQLVGRTINIWNSYSKPRPWLLDFFDMVQFYLVSDDQLSQIRDDYKLGKYEPFIEESTICFDDYKRFVSLHSKSIELYKEEHDLKKISSKIDWSLMQHFETATTTKNLIEKNQQESPDFYTDCYILKSHHYGNLYEIKIEENQSIKKGDIVALIEIMKTYHQIHSPVDAICMKVFAQQGKIIKQGQSIAALKLIES